MKEQFIRDAFTVKDIAKGFGTITWKVRGFWATPVEVHFERSWNINQTGVWKFEISHASGGHEEGVSDSERARNLAAALNDAADTVDFLKNVEGQIEAAFQEQIKESSAVFAI